MKKKKEIIILLLKEIERVFLCVVLSTFIMTFVLFKLLFATFVSLTRRFS
jgi:hypothetical protein